MPAPMDAPGFRLKDLARAAEKELEQQVKNWAEITLKRMIDQAFTIARERCLEQKFKVLDKNWRSADFEIVRRVIYRMIEDQALTGVISLGQEIGNLIHTIVIRIIW